MTFKVSNDSICTAEDGDPEEDTALVLQQYLEESDVVTIPYATTLTENEKNLHL